MARFLLLLSFLLTTSLAISQSSIRIAPNPAHVSAPASEADIKVDIVITNTSAETVDLLWTRDIIEAPAEWLTYICDKFNCYDPSQGECPEAAQNIVEPGQTMPFQIHVIPNNTPGMAMINIDLFQRGAPDDILGTIESTFETTTTSTGDLFAREDLRIYPNPTNDYFRVYQSDQVATIDVYNIVGNRVRTYAANSGGQYDVSQLPQGMYIVRLMDDKQQVMKTLRLSKN